MTAISPISGKQTFALFLHLAFRCGLGAPRVMIALDTVASAVIRRSVTVVSLLNKQNIAVLF